MANKYDITGALETPSPSVYADPYTDKKIELYKYDKTHWAQNLQMSQELSQAAETQQFMPGDESAGREYFVSGVNAPLENFYNTGMWNRADLAINESIKFATSDPKLMQFKRNAAEYSNYLELKNSSAGQQFGLVNFGQNPDEFQTVTYGKDGEEILNVFRNEAEIRLDKSTKKLQLIGDIAAAGEKPYFNKEGIDVDGDDIVDYLVYGQTGGGVSQSRINSVVSAVVDEYLQSSEGVQEYRELTELQGLTPDQARQQILDSMIGLAQNQYQSSSTTAVYIDQFKGTTSRGYTDDIKEKPDDILTTLLATSQQGDGTVGITDATFSAFFDPKSYDENLGGYIVGDDGEGLITNVAKDFNLLKNFDIEDLPNVVKNDILNGSLAGLSEENIMGKLIDWYSTLDPGSNQQDRNAKLTKELFGDILSSYSNAENAYFGEGMDNDENYPEGVKSYYEEIVRDYMLKNTNLTAENLGAIMNPAFKTGSVFRKTSNKAEVVVDKGGTYMVVPGEYVLTEAALESAAAEAGYGDISSDFVTFFEWFGKLDVDNITLPNGKPFAKKSTNSKGEDIWVIRGQYKQLISNDMANRLNKEIYTDSDMDDYGLHWARQRSNNLNIARAIDYEHKNIDAGRLTYRIPGANQVGDIDLTNAGIGIKESIKEIQTQSQAIFSMGNPFIDNTGQYVVLGDRRFSSFNDFIQAVNGEIADILVNQSEFDRKKAGLLLEELLQDLKSADFKWKK